MTDRTPDPIERLRASLADEPDLWSPPLRLLGEAVAALAAEVRAMPRSDHGRLFSRHNSAAAREAACAALPPEPDDLIAPQALPPGCLAVEDLSAYATPEFLAARAALAAGLRDAAEAAELYLRAVYAARDAATVPAWIDGDRAAMRDHLDLNAEAAAAQRTRDDCERLAEHFTTRR